MVSKLPITITININDLSIDKKTLNARGGNVVISTTRWLEG
jgi:hypothetical protein